MQSWSSKQRWYEEALSEGWTNYYNYFMSLTNASYRAGIVPHWCRLIGPVGPVLETRRAYYEVMDWISDAFGVYGDTVKISVLFCSVDLRAEYYEPYELWVRDTFDFSVNLSRIGDEQDRVILNIGVYGDPACSGWQEWISEWPGWYNYYYLTGYFKDMHWHLIEYEKVIPPPYDELNQWRVEIRVDQEALLGYTSDSVMWFNQFKVYHNGNVIWERNLGPEPDEDPPPKEIGSSIIRANNTPWERWGRPEPECFGGENNG